MVKGKSCPLSNPSNIVSTFPHYITQTTHCQSKLAPHQAASSFYHNVCRNTSSTAGLDLSSLNRIKTESHSVDRALNAETAAVEDVGVNHSG